MTAFSDLLGKTLVRCERVTGGYSRARRGTECDGGPFDDEAILFVCDDGSAFAMGHEPSCCESVAIESINGDLADLIGAPIVLADEASSGNGSDDAVACAPEGWAPGEYAESFTWTFYRLATRKGHVDIRWYGSSNGSYSESVDFVRCEVLP